MATKKFLHDLDLQSVGQLKNARIQNVTSADITSLTGSLGASNRGLLVYNTTDKSLYTWNGTAFDKYSFDIVGDILFKGIINPNLSSTVVPVSGHQYVVDTAGTLSTQLGSITYTPSANVEVGDVVLFTSATTASIIERNLEQATTSTAGTIRISTQAEVDAGTTADEAVTPATLHGYVNPEFDADRARLTAAEADIGALQSDLTSEVSRATAAEGVLQDNIDDEAVARTAADTAEASARAAADTTLQSNIDAEATARAAADTAEASARAAADTAEASARAAADTTLQANIDAEASARAAADTTLQGNINSEASARAAADTAEASARAAADTALDGRVTALEARDEVFVYTASVDLVADTALTVSHNLGLTNKDSFTINTMHNGEQVSVQVTSVNVNSLTLTSAVGVTGLVVSIIGF